MIYLLLTICTFVNLSSTAYETTVDDSPQARLKDNVDNCEDYFKYLLTKFAGIQLWDTENCPIDHASRAYIGHVFAQECGRPDSKSIICSCPSRNIDGREANFTVNCTGSDGWSCFRTHTRQDVENLLSKHCYGNRIRRIRGLKSAVNNTSQAVLQLLKNSSKSFQQQVAYLKGEASKQKTKLDELGDQYSKLKDSTSKLQNDGESIIIAMKEVFETLVEQYDAPLTMKIRKSSIKEVTIASLGPESPKFLRDFRQQFTDLSITFYKAIEDEQDVTVKIETIRSIYEDGIRDEENLNNRTIKDLKMKNVNQSNIDQVRIEYLKKTNGLRQLEIDRLEKFITSLQESEGELKNVIKNLQKFDETSQTLAKNITVAINEPIVQENTDADDYAVVQEIYELTQEAAYQNMMVEALVNHLTDKGNKSSLTTLYPKLTELEGRMNDTDKSKSHQDLWNKLIELKQKLNAAGQREKYLNTQFNHTINDFQVISANSDKVFKNKMDNFEKIYAQMEDFNDAELQYLQSKNDLLREQIEMLQDHRKQMIALGSLFNDLERAIDQIEMQLTDVGSKINDANGNS